VLNRVKPARKPLIVPNPSQLSYDRFMKRCDAVIFDAPALAVLRRHAPDRYGPLVGRIVTKERYAAVFEKGSLLRPAINGALITLAKNGTIARLRQRWLGTDKANLADAPRIDLAINSTKATWAETGAPRPAPAG
jgi:hypothetical protein